VRLLGSTWAAAARATVQLTAHGSTDPDGDSLAYSWQVLEAPQGQGGISLTGPVEALSFIALSPGRYRFELVGSDLRHGSSIDTVTVTVARDSRQILWLALVILLGLLVVLAILVRRAERQNRP
jgi:hypothetical protein